MSLGNSNFAELDLDVQRTIFTYPRNDPPVLVSNDLRSQLADQLAETALVVCQPETWPLASAHALGYACPFFIRNPAGHGSCLQNDLREILCVKRHIWA